MNFEHHLKIHELCEKFQREWLVLQENCVDEEEWKTEHALLIVHYEYKLEEIDNLFK